MLKWLLFIGAIVGLYFIVNVSSMRPDKYVFETGISNNYSTAQEINEPEYNKYIFGKLSSGSDITDYYVYNLKKIVPQFNIELLVPRTGEVNNFHPSLIIIDQSNKSVVGRVPFGFPPNIGGRVLEWEGEEKIDSSDTFLNFWRGPNTITDLPPGEYGLAVFDPESGGGNYVIKIGAQDASESIVDLPKEIIAWLRIKLSIY
jgi:hypothetical protein